MAGIKTYNASLRAIRNASGITHRQAQEAWRQIRDRVGHAPTPREIKSTPKIVAQAAAKAPRTLAARDAAATRQAKRLAVVEAAIRKTAARSAAARKGAETRRRNAERKRQEELLRKGDKRWGAKKVEGLRRYIPGRKARR